LLRIAAIIPRHHFFILIEEYHKYSTVFVICFPHLLFSVSIKIEDVLPQSAVKYLSFPFAISLPNAEFSPVSMQILYIKSF